MSKPSSKDVEKVSQFLSDSSETKNGVLQCCKPRIIEAGTVIEWIFN
jgi:hypothetical protein